MTVLLTNNRMVNISTVEVEADPTNRLLLIIDPESRREITNPIKMPSAQACYLVAAVIATAVAAGDSSLDIDLVLKHRDELTN